VPQLLPLRSDRGIRLLFRMPTEDKTPEREQTDESLHVEREKADADLGEKQAAIDESADAIIEKARARADQVLAAVRTKSDLQLGPPNACIWTAEGWAYLAVLLDLYCAFETRSEAYDAISD
jgi:hypothetical protein